MALTATTWPIAAAMLPFEWTMPKRDDDDTIRSLWSQALEEVADAGFDNVDLTDSWVACADLVPRHRAMLREAMDDAGVSAIALSAIRRSIIDAEHGEENLAYSHRTLDVAAELGIGVVSFGLHQALTAAQREVLWFWTVPGHQDRPGDHEARRLAVRRFRELGEHAQQLGILVSLEMYEHTYLGSASSAVQLVEEIGLPSVGLNPDIGNLIRLHEPVADWRETLRATLPYSNYWHVKNYLRDEEPSTGAVMTHPASLESGFIDYRWALREAVAAGFQGAICVEHYGGDGLSVSATNRDHLRNRVLPRRQTAHGRSRVAQQYEGTER